MLMDNLIERSGDVIAFRDFKTFERLHLKYINFNMRQFLWKGVLFDPVLFKQYKQNMAGPNSVFYQASRDEPLILHEIQQIFGELDWTGDLNRIVQEKAANIQLFKQVLIYTLATLGKTGLSTSSYYLLVPLISVFRNYQFEERLPYLTSMFITLIQRVQQQIVVPKHSDEDEFVREFGSLRETFLDGLEQLDSSLAERFRTRILTANADGNDVQLQRKAGHIREDMSHGDNRHFFYPLSTETVDNVLSLDSNLLLHDFIKQYIDKLSCGYAHLDVSQMIIDALLTKRYKEKNDRTLIRSLSVITVLLKDHGMAEAQSMYDVIKVIERKAATAIHEYEFYKLFRGLMARDVEYEG